MRFFRKHAGICGDFWLRDGGSRVYDGRFRPIPVLATRWNFWAAGLGQARRPCLERESGVRGTRVPGNRFFSVRTRVFGGGTGPEPAPRFDNPAGSSAACRKTSGRPGPKVRFLASGCRCQFDHPARRDPELQRDLRPEKIGTGRGEPHGADDPGFARDLFAIQALVAAVEKHIARFRIRKCSQERRPHLMVQARLERLQLPGRQQFPFRSIPQLRDPAPREPGRRPKPPGKKGPDDPPEPWFPSRPFPTPPLPPETKSSRRCNTYPCAPPLPPRLPARRPPRRRPAAG